MPDFSASIRHRRNTVSTTSPPNAPTNLRLSPNSVPNPTQTSIRIAYDAATVPAGSPAVDGYKVFVNGVHNKSVAATVLDTTITNLASSTTFAITVKAYNTVGDSAASNALNATTSGVTPPPSAPLNFTATSVGITSASFSWSVVTASPAPGYRIYQGSETTPRLTVAAGTGTTGTVQGLTAATSYTFAVRAFNSNGESGNSNVVTLTTNPDTGVTQVMRTDDVLNYNGFNVKVTYGSGTYDFTTAANKQAVIDYSIGTGMRIYRQEPAVGGATQTAQMDFMKALYAANGTKFHGTLGVLADTSAVTDLNAVRTTAAADIKGYLDMLATDWKNDPGLANGGDLAKVIHSLGGPNEIENTTNNGSNWAAHGRIYQEQIWRGMREGKFWVTASNAYTAQRVGTGTGNAALNFPVIFANIPVAAPSMRTDLLVNPNNGISAAGNVINTTTGDRYISQFVEMGNPHLYQAGESPSRQIQAMIDVFDPLVPDPGYPTIPYIFSETGYNHMGWNLNGSDQTTTTLSGNVKVPPWVHSTYSVRAIADYAAMKIPYIRHELLDDAHSALNIQYYFGVIWTQTADPTTWTPMGDYYALRRMYNLLKDRVNPKNPATHSTTALPYTITNNGGTGANFKHLVTQKADGSYWMLLWRDVNVFTPTNSGNTGTAVNVANVNIGIQLTHSTGTKSVGSWQPNKAVWSGTGTTVDATGQANAATWDPIPTPEQTWSVASGGVFTVPLGGDLKVLRIT